MYRYEKKDANTKNAQKSRTRIYEILASPAGGGKHRYRWERNCTRSQSVKGLSSSCLTSCRKVSRGVQFSCLTLWRDTRSRLLGGESKSAPSAERFRLSRILHDDEHQYRLGLLSTGERHMVSTTSSLTKQMHCKSLKSVKQTRTFIASPTDQIS